VSLLPTEWSPLEEQFHTWDIVLLNPPNDERVLSLWSNISITETHEGIRTQIEINAEEPAIPFIRELVTDFLFYRDRQLLYRLRVVDSEDVLTRDAATVRFDCVSYDKLFERRILHEDWLLDDGDIQAAWRLIDYTQRKHTFGITRGTTDHGARRQRALDAGDDILTAINDFAQAEGGFDWWIDQNLKFWAVKPRRGQIRNIQWQLGGEVAEMTRVNPIEDYASLIMATGANSEVRIPRSDGQEDVYPPPDPQIVQLPTKPLGLWEMTTSDTDVITTGSLLEKALWHLGDKGNVRPTYKLMLEPGAWTPTVGIGDTIQLRINTVRANVKVPIRIEELSINCTADGAETISLSVRAEQAETPITSGGGLIPLPQLLAGNAPDPNGRTVARHRLSDADDLGAILRSLRKRLDRAERSRGIGGGGGANILDGEGPPPATIGSPGDYYVDTHAQQLYGPKEDGDISYPPPVTWTTAPANAVRLNQECSIILYGDYDLTIHGFRYGGTPDASDLTVTFWNYYTKEILYQTTGPGTGSDGMVMIPPITIPRAVDYAGYGGFQFVVSLGGAAVPVHAPGGTYPTGLPGFLSMISPEGLYTSPLGVREATWTGTVATLDLNLLVSLDLGVIVGPEVCTTVSPEYMPNLNIHGEVGTFDVVGSSTVPVRLLGWRYRRMASSSAPLTWHVWNVISVGASNSTPPLGEILATVVTEDADEGEYEVRLPTAIDLDPTETAGPQGVLISAGGEKVPIYDRTITNWADTPSFYYSGLMPMMNETIGELPYHGVPGLPGGPWTGAFLMFPIVQEIRTVWPLSNIARSHDPPNPRAELRRKLDFVDEYWSDDDGLHFYQGGPSHPYRSYEPGRVSTADGGDGVESDVPWWDVCLHYDGNSGVELVTNWFYNNYYRKHPDTGESLAGWLSNVGSWHAWYWDYAYQEQDCDLDEWDPYFPGGYYMIYNEQSTWDDLAANNFATYGPNYGTGMFEDGVRLGYDHSGGAGFGCEVSEIGVEPFIETAGLARMWAATDDELGGTSLTVTPRVIQASFPPHATSRTWWNPGYINGLTPKGCVSPLITAASATATAADEPWQKQFFRQIGLNDVSFSDGLGHITVPTAMALPAVVHAQVDGISPGGHRVAQCQRAGDYTIAVALDTTHTGTVPINWSVEAAALTFGTPPPSISFMRNPGTFYNYGNYVDYDAAGGFWPFEIIGGNLADGCILKDFTGATVGGPFTPSEDTEYADGTRIFWSAGRDWYLPGQTQQYRIVNPDNQVSNWYLLNWVDEVGLRSAKDSTLRSQRNMNALGISLDKIAEEDLDLLRKPDISNNPRMRPVEINPLAAKLRGAEPTPSRIGGKQNRQEQKDWVARQQALRGGNRPTGEPTGEESPEPPPPPE
jgi:hypothetical protein